MIERGCGAVFEFILERLFAGFWKLLVKPLHDGFDRSHSTVQWAVWAVIVASLLSCAVGWVGHIRGAEWARAALIGDAIALLATYACMLLVGWCVRLWE